MENERIGKTKVVIKLISFLTLLVGILSIGKLPLVFVLLSLLLFCIFNPSSRKNLGYFGRSLGVILFTSTFGLFRLNGRIILKVGPILITTGGLELALLTFLKLSSLMLLSLIIFSKFDPSEFELILKVFLAPFPISKNRKKKLMTIMLLSYRFTPVLFRKFEHEMKKDGKKKFSSRLKIIPRVIRETFEESLKDVKKMMEDESAREVKSDE